MTSTAAALVLMVSVANAGPTVVESTGDLSYAYDFELPKARGRYQPELALVYSSADNRDVGYGHGWTLTSVYIERDTRAVPGRSTTWLVSGKNRKLLVPFNVQTVFRPEVEDVFFEVTALSSGATYSARDASGSTYFFDRVFGNRTYLTRVTDLDGNVVTFGFDVDKEDPVSIQYNVLPNAPSTFATTVRLEFGTGLDEAGTSVPSAPRAAAGGAVNLESSYTYMAERTSRLTRVRVLGGVGAAQRTIRGYDVRYTPAGAGDVTSVSRITQLGVDLTGELPPTRFVYAIASSYGVEASQPGALPLVPKCFKPSESLVDLDGDGRVDFACWGTLSNGQTGILWLRNVTPIGGATVAFASNYTEVSTPAWGYLRDFDGDGVPDIVYPWLNGSANMHSIYRGQVGGTTVTYSSSPIVLDVTAYCPPLSQDLIRGAGTIECRVIADMNGDGVMDYGRPSAEPCYADAYPFCACSFALTRLNANGTGELVPFAARRFLPGCPLELDAQNTYSTRSDTTPAVDINGDGLADAVRNPGTFHTNSLGSANYRTTTGMWIVGLNVGHVNDFGTTQYWVNDSQFSGYGDSPNIRLDANSSICSLATVDDQVYGSADLLDFNGDGRPDFFNAGGLNSSQIAWNTGRAFGALVDVVGPTSDGKQWARWDGTLGGVYDWKSSQSCSPNSGVYDCCSAEVPMLNYAGEFTDMNGDGIPDFLWRTFDPPSVSAMRGQVTLLDPSAGELPIARPMLLQKVVVPDGGEFSIQYVPSTTLAVPRARLKPVVSALTVSGANVEKSTTYYWYANPSGEKAWYDPAKFDDRGFRESWSQNETTRIVRHTTWSVSHALVGRPTLVELGIASNRALGRPAVSSDAGAPPSAADVAWFSRDSFQYRLKWLGDGRGLDCLAAGEPSATDYPVRVVPKSVAKANLFGTTQATVTTAVDCADVDDAGNFLRVVSTPSLYGTPGPALVTTQSFVGATSCVNVPAELTTSRWSGTKELTRAIKTFDTDCRLIEEWSPDEKGGRTNRIAYTYAGPLKQLDTTTTGATTKRAAYDATYGLYVKQETTEDSAKTISTTYEYDEPTGLRISAVGPSVTRDLSGGTTSAGLARYYLYDAFGRTVAVSKQPFATSTDASTAAYVPRASGTSSVVEVTRYLDSVMPRAVETYRFAVAKAFSTTEGFTDSDDVMKSTVYRDGLGRVIQVRERLGGAPGGAADAAAQVNQAVRGVKVSKALVLDGAGRERASLEPFYADGESFVDYTVDGAVPVVRGTITTYDDQLASFGYTRRGAAWCTSYQVITAGKVPGPAADCVSDSSNTSRFRLATETRTTIRTISGGTYGLYVATEVIPPDVNAIGGSTPRVTLAGPGGEQLGSIDGDGNFTWIERDVMGREVASWREGASRSIRTPIPVSTIKYNLAGQVVETWDANFPTVAQTNTYDEAGRLSFVTKDPNTKEGIAYVYGAGGLGRVTEVREVTYPGGVTTERVLAQNHYDTGYGPDYTFVSGKLSWTLDGDGNTFVAYAYDDAGRVSRRDQWFGPLGQSKRFTVNSTYGADGRVLDSCVVNPFDASRIFRYKVEYDSAGRPVVLSGSYRADCGGTDIAGTSAKIYEAVLGTNVYGAYDALGRVPVMRADDGRVVSARVYGANSGALVRECKRFSNDVSCVGTSLEAQKDIYRTDAVDATYRGAKLASYSDAATGTRYQNAYLSSGRLQNAMATPTSTVGDLTQDWTAAFVFNGIGNLDGIATTRDASSGNARTDYSWTERYGYASTSSGELLDRAVAMTSSGTVPPTSAGTTAYAYDLLGHLTSVTRSAGESENLYYAPGGELLYRQIGERFVFYVGEYATVTARGAPGCGASCTPQLSTVELDAHVVFAGTRIASVKPSRTLYYYRTRLGTVIATSLSGGVVGAAYRYDAYGALDAVTNETEATRSELGYTNALLLSGSLIYLKTRVYDTKARLFIQSDIVDRLRYAYVAGDPVNSSDPTGLAAIESAPSMTVSIIQDGSVWRVVERDNNTGRLTVTACYDAQFPGDTASRAKFAQQIALQSEQGSVEYEPAAAPSSREQGTSSVRATSTNGASRIPTTFEARKPGKSPPGKWPDEGPPEEAVGKKPKWNPEGYWEGKGDRKVTWDDRSHGTGVDRGKGKQDGHWDDESSNNRWDRYGNLLPGSPDLKRAESLRAAEAAAATIGAGYVIYRVVRFAPSLFPALWPTIPVNAVVP